jgi:hypothetical protein
MAYPATLVITNSLRIFIVEHVALKRCSVLQDWPAKWCGFWGSTAAAHALALMQQC